MNESISFWHQAGALSLAGTAGSWTALKAQWSRAFCESPVSLSAPPAGAGAPIRTHFSKVAIFASLSFGPDLRGGIESSGSSWWTATSSRDFLRLPGTTAGPWSPPASSAARESMIRPPLETPSAAEWHL